jgi:hypothetical protein
MSPRRKRRAIVAAKGAVHLALTRRLDGTGITANEHFVLAFLTTRIPWRKWAVRNVPAHIRGPWQRRALRNLLTRQPQLHLDKTGAEALLTDLERRGLITGTAVTAQGRACLAEIAARPAPTTPAPTTPVVQEAYVDPQLLADARKVLADVAKQVRKNNRTS